MHALFVINVYVNTIHPLNFLSTLQSKLSRSVILEEHVLIQGPSSMLVNLKLNQSTTINKQLQLICVYANMIRSGCGFNIRSVLTFVCMCTSNNCAKEKGSEQCMGLSFRPQSSFVMFFICLIVMSSTLISGYYTHTHTHKIRLNQLYTCSCLTFIWLCSGLASCMQFYWSSDWSEQNVLSWKVHQPAIAFRIFNYIQQYKSIIQCYIAACHN